MIDTIHLFLEVDFENNKSLSDHITSCFNEDVFIGKSKITGQNYLLGKLKNLKVKLTTNSISIEGSVCKYFYGNNFKTLEYRQFIYAIRELEKILRINLDHALVRRIDMAQNLIMKQLPCSYYPLFIKGGYLKRREDDNGLYYRNNNRTILLYDKVNEMKKSRVEVDPLYDGMHLMRYEFRMNRSREVAKRLDLPHARLKDVCKEWDALVYYWQQSFQLIVKDVELVIPEDKFFESPTSYLQFLALQGIKQIGSYGSVINMIHEANARKIFKYPSQASNIKRMVKGLIEKTGVNKTSEMVLEVQTAIDNASSWATRSAEPY